MGLLGLDDTNGPQRLTATGDDSKPWQSEGKEDVDKPKKLVAGRRVDH